MRKKNVLMRRDPVLFGLRLAILKQAKYLCHYCGGKAYQIDHKIPVKHGGAHVLENLVPCCRNCNYLKGTLNYKVFLRFVKKKDFRLQEWQRTPKRFLVKKRQLDKKFYETI